MSTYLYAIAEGAPRLAPGFADGVPDGASQCSVIEAAGLAAVTSDYGGPQFSDLSRAQILSALLAHQQVLDRIIPGLPLLPVKFGTLLGSEDEVRTLLERFHDPLREALEDVGDSFEVDLSATWDVQTVLAEVAQSPAVAQASTNVSPHAGLTERIRVGQLVHEALEERREQYRRCIVADLLPLARDAQPNPRPSQDMVVNVSFLVERSGMEAFESKVDQWGEELAGRLTFRYVGPLPPYSFATVQISRPRRAEIEAAREELGLSERFTEEEVGARFRELVRKEHPDRNPGDPSARERFDALTTARDRLVSYLRALPGARSTGVADGGDLLLRVVRADEYVSPETESSHASGTLG